MGSPLDNLREKAAEKLSILPDAPECPECGRELEPTTVYDRTMYEYTEAWSCEACDYHEYRDDTPL